MVFSKRELTFTFAIMLSPVCLSSVTFVHLLSRLKFLAMFLRRLIPWPSVDIRRKFYGDRPRATPLLEAGGGVKRKRDSQM